MTTPPTTTPAAPEIAVSLFAGAAAEYGAETATVRGTTLQEVLDALVAGTTERGATAIRRSSFLVNGSARTDLDRPLAAGDRVDVLPPFAGG
ncbi:MoaD/ThiS family protein [Brachybacterium sp. DNPG3]